MPCKALAHSQQVAIAIQECCAPHYPNDDDVDNVSAWKTKAARRSRRSQKISRCQRAVTTNTSGFWQALKSIFTCINSVIVAMHEMYRCTLTDQSDNAVGNMRGGVSPAIDNDRTCWKYLWEPSTCSPVVDPGPALGGTSRTLVFSLLEASSTARSILSRSTPHNVRVCIWGILRRKET